MKDKGILGKIHIPGKWLAIVGIIVLIIAIILLIMNFVKGDEAVDFKVLTDAEIPQDITSQVIPQYRGLERALACVVGDKVYVLVTRGEKPSSGFEIGIDKMVMESGENGDNLIVYADFKDPEPGTALSQVLTYPLEVAETSLTELPEQIELRVQFE